MFAFLSVAAQSNRLSRHFIPRNRKISTCVLWDMTAITFRSDSSVELIDFMGSDAQVVHAARISTGGNRLEPMPKTTAGLINYLIKNRHGTPFEHNAFTFRVECPIFVAREFMRHRCASFNEESGRYKQLDA